jgi:hypothetical protein
MENDPLGQIWWHIPVVSDTREGEVGGSWSEASMGKSMRTLSKYKLKQKSVGGRKLVPFLSW